MLHPSRAHTVSHPGTLNRFRVQSVTCIEHGNPDARIPGRLHLWRHDVKLRAVRHRVKA